MKVVIVIRIPEHSWPMIPKNISFSLYKYFESIKNLSQNGQILSVFHFSSLKNGKSMTYGILIHNYICPKITKHFSNSLFKYFGYFDTIFDIRRWKCGNHDNSVWRYLIIFQKKKKELIQDLSPKQSKNVSHPLAIMILSNFVQGCLYQLYNVFLNNLTYLPG